MFQPARGGPALSGATDHSRRGGGIAFGQLAARRDQAGDGAYEPVRSDPQGAVRQLELTMSLPQFVALQMYVGQGDTRGRAGELGQPVAAVLGGSRCSVGEVNDVAPPPAPSPHQGEGAQ